MKLLPLYPCLFAILFQITFASSLLNSKGASLSTSKAAPLKSRKSHAKAKPVAGKLAWRKRSPGTKKSQNVEIDKDSKSKDVVAKENRSNS